MLSLARTPIITGLDGHDRPLGGLPGRTLSRLILSMQDSNKLLCCPHFYVAPRALERKPRLAYLPTSLPPGLHCSSSIPATSSALAVPQPLPLPTSPPSGALLDPSGQGPSRGTTHPPLHAALPSQPGSPLPEWKLSKGRNLVSQWQPPPNTSHSAWHQCGLRVC